MNTVYYFLACFGFSLALTKLHVGEKIRELFCWKADENNLHSACNLINCIACVGFWAGFGLSMALQKSVSSLSGIMVADAALDGLCVLSVNWILYVVLMKLDMGNL